MKQWLTRCLIGLCSFYFRHFPGMPGNQILFDRLVGRAVRRLARRNPIESTVMTRFGASMIVRPNEFIDSYICLFGLWEPAITDYISSGLSRGDTFVDIGANIGYYSLLAASRVGPRGHVYAIEASPMIFARLKQNLALNSFDNITATNVAVTGRRSRVSVYRHDGNNSGNTTIMESERSTHHRLEAVVEGLPLNDIIPWEVVEAARFVKIDIEGAEWTVVQNIKDSLHSLSDRTEIILEITAHAIERSGGSIPLLVDIFDRAGFDAFCINNTYATSEYTQGGPLSLTPFVDLTVTRADLVLKRKRRSDLAAIASVTPTSS
jgi:FkbM family methyltransferase